MILQPVVDNWKKMSQFFWADVFLMIDEVFCNGKLLSRTSKTKDAVEAADDLVKCIGCLRNLCRNSHKSKGPLPFVLFIYNLIHY